MFFTKLACSIFFVSITILALGQNQSSTFQRSKNFVTYKFGAGFPILSSTIASNYNYTFSGKSINYSVNAGFEIGHTFSKVFGISTSPVLMYSKFSQFNYHYTIYEGERLEKELYGNTRLSHLSVQIPVNFNFQIMPDVTFTPGMYFLKPLVSRTFGTGVWTDYNYEPPKTLTDLERNYKHFDLEWRGGVSGQVSYTFKSYHWREKRICIEYYHSFSKLRYNGLEKWLILSYKKILYK